MTRRAAGVVPRAFIALARIAVRHPDPDRFALLYRLLWRLQKDRSILGNLQDTDVGKLRRRVDGVVHFEQGDRSAKRRSA